MDTDGPRWEERRPITDSEFLLHKDGIDVWMLPGRGDYPAGFVGYSLTRTYYSSEMGTNLNFPPDLWEFIKAYTNLTQ